MTKRFIITGCGRSGTTYTARLLSELGCTCGHEQFFTGCTPSPAEILLARTGVHPLQWKMPPIGEAAWEAAPFLSLLPAETQIFHQLRHPLAFIRSRQKKGWVHGKLRSRHLRHLPTLNKERFWALPLAAQVELLARFWIDWNALVEKQAGERPCFRYRVEDFGPDLLRTMLDLIEFRCEEHARERTLDAIDTSTNTRGEKRDDITLELLSPALRVELERAARRYGYAL